MSINFCGKFNKYTKEVNILPRRMQDSTREDAKREENRMAH